jgi:hypothetical protein
MVPWTQHGPVDAGATAGWLAFALLQITQTTAQGSITRPNFRKLLSEKSNISLFFLIK